MLTISERLTVLFRDPANLLWSAYNFRKIPGLHRGGEGRAKERKHYRSPEEMFHELRIAFWKQDERFGHQVHDPYDPASNY